MAEDPRTAGPSARSSRCSPTPFDDRDRNTRPDDGWRVLIQNRAVRRFVRLFAICSDTRVSYRRKTVTAAANTQSGEFDTICPAGTEGAGGGFRGARTVFENSSFPLSAEGWGGYLNNRGARPKQVTAHAICVRVQTQNVTSDSTAIDAGERGVRVVQCPSETHVYAGGHANSAGFIPFYASSSRPIGTPKPDEGWRAVMDNRSAVDISLASSRAVCGPSLN